MSYWDKWYSWLLTPVSHAIRNAGQGLYQGTKDILTNDNNGDPWDLEFSDDDWSKLIDPYSDQIQKLRDAGYGDNVDAILNQWKGTLTSYHPGVLDRFAGLVDGRSGRSKWYENVAAQLGESLKGLQDQRQMNDYDSPLQQSARERQAGINSDLLGIGDVAGAAAPAEDTNNVLPETSALTDLGSFASTLGECFEFAMQTVGFTQEFQSNRNNILMQRTQLESSYIDFADKFILSNTPDSFPADGWQNEPYISPDGEEGVKGDFFSTPESYIRANILSDFKKFKSRYGSMFSKRQWSHINRLLSHQVNSLPNSKEQWSSWRSQLSDKVGYAMESGSKYYDSMFDELRKALEPLIKLNDDIREMVFKHGLTSEQSGIAQDEYNTDYYNSLSGTAMAGFTQGIQSGQLQGLGLDNYIKGLNNKVETARKGVITKLSELADSGNVLARAMLFRYSIVSSIISPAVSVIGSIAKFAK